MLTGLVGVFDETAVFGETAGFDETAVFFTEVFGVEEEALGLAAAGFAFLTESVRDFAGLFIAFAMESNTNLVTLICAMVTTACSPSV
ncbi:hypothetical protein ACIPF8_08275 [Collimonas sp. NPDC087041]|uniref:hypothetical protein n=1 Tax=Collimonas sp. NPDC087041 TaxID=3363960 RepID=UPI003803A327